MKRKWTFALMLSAIGLLTAADAQACSCAYRSLAQQYVSADLIYTGMVLEIDTVDQQLEVRMDTREVFKGTLPSELVLRTHVSSATCGYPFSRVGEEYLVFAHAPNEHNDFPSTNLCTRTRPISDAAEDLEALRNGPDTSPYLPIAPGNVWTYGITSHPVAGGFPVTLQIDNVVQREDRTYFSLTGLPLPADTLFQDRFGNIWWQRDGTDAMLIDFDLPEGHAYTIQTDSTYYIVTGEHDVTAHLQLGTFEDCIRFVLESPSTEQTWSFTFAPEVGPILATSSTGVWYELLGGTLSGRPVASNPSEQPADIGLIGSVHPNPFIAEAVVTVDVPERVHLRLTVHDVLGREVAQLADAPAGPGTVQFSWDASPYPVGVYFFRAEADGRTTVLSAVRQ